MVTKILIVSIPDHTSGVVKAGHANASRCPAYTNDIAMPLHHMCRKMGVVNCLFCFHTRMLIALC